MGAIWTSRTRSRQPSGPARINWGNPLTRGMQAASLPTQGLRDVVTGELWTTWGTAPSRIGGRHGVAWDNTAAYGGLMFLPSKTIAVDEQTHVLIVEATASSGAYAGLLSVSNAASESNSLSYQRDGSDSGWASWANNPAVTIGPTGTAFGPTVMVLANNTTIEFLWRDGALSANVSNAATAISDSRIVLFGERGASTTYSIKGRIWGYFGFGRKLSDAEIIEVSRNPWDAFAPQRTARIYSFPTGATNYSVTATDALTLADSASNVASLGAAGSDALTLADSASNVAALSATATDALSLADSASNVAALSATASDALPLADTLNATASGDYTATGSDALTLADSATNVASLGATGADALTLADAASNAAALGAAASDALTLADTLNASASGDYVVTATDALSLSDSVVAAYAAICIATDALTLADATSAAMAGEYAATATDALTLADAVSNAAALGVSISEALTLAELVSALNSGQLVLGVRGRPGVQIQTGTRRAQIQTGTRRN